MPETGALKSALSTAETVRRLCFQRTSANGQAVNFKLGSQLSRTSPLQFSSTIWVQL